MDTLHKLYYSPAGYQKGKTAAFKLNAKFPSFKKQQMQRKLDRQSVHQIYKQKPMAIKFHHYTPTTPNYTPNRCFVSPS